VVRDAPPEEIGVPIDWSAWYLTDEDDMSEACEQSEIIKTARSSAEELAREQPPQNTLIGADAFFAWMENEPNVRVSPDLYLLDDPPPPPLPKMWQTWLPGHRAPRFALEIVSNDWEKDYLDNPDKYALLGTAEYVIFDPDAITGVAPKRHERVPFQVYRREPDGRFVCTYRGAGPVYSVELGAWLVAEHRGQVVRVRLARDAEGKDIVPTTAEARDAADRKLAAADQKLAAAEREIAALRAQLERKG
jgi:Uma2 family endonuclease